MWTLPRLSIALSQMDLLYMIRHLTNKMYCLYAQARRAPVLPWALQVVELLEPLSPGPVMLSGCNVPPWFFEPYAEWIRLGHTGLSWDPEPAKFPRESLASRPLQVAGTALSLKDCGSLGHWKGADILVLGDSLSGQKENEFRTSLDYKDSLSALHSIQGWGPWISIPRLCPDSATVSSLQRLMSRSSSGAGILLNQLGSRFYSLLTVILSTLFDTFKPHFILFPKWGDENIFKWDISKVLRTVPGTE